MSRLSREQKRELKRTGSETVPPIDVRVSAEGSATVGGVPVPAAEPLHAAVLDHLHRLALATGHPVLATVHDERIGYVVPLQVYVDGSSQYTGEPVRVSEPAQAALPPPEPAEQPRPQPPADPQPKREPTTMPLGAAPQPEPSHAPTPSTFVLRALPDPQPGPPSGEFGPAPLVEEETAPKPAPVREFAVAEAVVDAVEAEDAPPSPFSAQITHINAAVKTGRIGEAAQLSEHTVAEATARYGPEHPEVLRLRELTAYIAYLAGDALRSFHLSLDLARLRRHLRDPRAAYGNVQSAAAAWRAVRDPLQGLNLGHDLITVWTELASEPGPAADDTEQLQSARTRMGRLANRAQIPNDNPYARGQ
ncbi:tetratricopeptide repeat protein [Streptomyces sp. NPDC002845]